MTSSWFFIRQPVIQFCTGRSRQRTDPSVFEQQRKESQTLPVQVVGPEMTDKTPCQRKYYLPLPCAISRILVTCTFFLYPSRKNQQQQCVFVRPRTRIAFGATLDSSWSLSTAVNSTRFLSVIDFHGTQQKLKVSQPLKISSEFYEPKSELPCLISGFRREVGEICALMGYYVACSGNSLPTFRDSLSVPSSRVHKTKKNIPEERRSR